MKRRTFLSNAAAGGLLAAVVPGAASSAQSKPVSSGAKLQVISTPRAPKPVGPFSQAIKANGFVFVAGITPRDPQTGQVIEGDSQIDQEENHVEEECLKILALHQPVAVDLRRIAAALKINTDLERMADLAEDIAGRARHLAGLPPFPVPRRLQAMTDLTTTMVRESLDSFVNLDPRQARRICRLDDEVDRYNDEIIREVLDTMRRSPELVEPGLSLFSATRHLERIADHATNIAEDVVYLVEGEIIRHRPAAVEVE
jgi:phosphate transport system protein